jgi:signal transduction histidine kinase
MKENKTECHLLKILFTIFLLFTCFTTICFGYEKTYVKDTFLVKMKVDSLLHEVDSLMGMQSEYAELIIDTTLNFSKAIGYKKGEAESILKLGTIYEKRVNFKEAHKYYNQSIEISKALNDRMLLFRSLKSRGNLFYSNGFNEDALNNYITAMKIAEEENFQKEKILIYNNVGLVFSEQKNYEKAKEYIQKSLSLDPSSNIKYNIYNNLGIQYFHLHNYDSAGWCYHQSLIICDIMKKEELKAAPLANLGLLYSKQKKYEKALEYFHKAKKIYDKLGLKLEQIPTLSNLGRLYQDLGDYKSAIKYLEKGMDYAQEANNKSIQYKLHFNLAWVYKDIGEVDLSWGQIMIYKNLSDSIQSIESNKRIENLLAKFEIEQKEKEIELLNKEKELQIALLVAKQSEVERQSQFRNITIISSIIIVIPILILLVVYQQKIKANELLTLRNEEINKQKILKLIQDHEMKTINATIEAQEKERIRIASDLHDGIGGTLASIKLNLVQVKKEIGGQKLKNIICKVDDTCQEIRTISHHLMPLKILQSSFKEMIENYLKEIAESNSLKLTFSSYPKNKINQLPDETKIEVYRIIQELVNNIIKHAYAKHIDVQITGHKGFINILIEDTGVGFDTSKINYGIGLNSIQSRVHLLKGDFNIDSSIGRGTIVNIDIPTDWNLY